MYHFTCERYFSPSLIHSVKLLIVLSVLIVINVSSLVNGGSNPSVIQVSQEPNPKMKMKNDRRIDLVELIHNPMVREKVDIYYLYNISFYVLKNHLTSCMDSNSRAFADCVYNSEKKWGPISDEDIKSTCCSFWEADECLTQLVVSSCTQNQSSWYLEADELISNKKLLQDDFCSSYQQMSDCDFPFWLVVAIIVSLVILFFICGFAVLNNFMRRESVNSKLTIYNQKSSTVNRQHY